MVEGQLERHIGMSVIGSGVLICSTRCSTQVAATEHIEFSLPGNGVGLKITGQPSLPFCLPTNLGRDIGC